MLVLLAMAAYAATGASIYLVAMRVAGAKYARFCASPKGKAPGAAEKWKKETVELLRFLSIFWAPAIAILIVVGSLVGAIWVVEKVVKAVQSFLHAHVRDRVFERGVQITEGKIARETEQAALEAKRRADEEAEAAMIQRIITEEGLDAEGLLELLQHRDRVPLPQPAAAE
ncbi:MAG TPA: hypothetical protein VLF91_02735 [Candidatus Saccharimonadales bacterium]|nr:hypothetical protein [Candidatus Saccharimonadales bacterium]